MFTEDQLGQTYPASVFAAFGLQSCRADRGGHLRHRALDRSGRRFRGCAVSRGAIDDHPRGEIAAIKFRRGEPKRCRHLVDLVTEQASRGLDQFADRSRRAGTSGERAAARILGIFKLRGDRLERGDLVAGDTVWLKFGRVRGSELLNLLRGLDEVVILHRV